jgi:hypothetical protein
MNVYFFSIESEQAFWRLVIRNWCFMRILNDNEDGCDGIIPSKKQSQAF